MRRDFELREIDRDYLARLGLSWETIREQGTDWLVIDGWPVPPGYSASQVKVALQISSGYPETQIDMAYLFPALARRDGRAIACITSHVIAGATFQRWSRHRTQHNPWVSGEDCVETHIALVNLWLHVELKR